MTLHFFEAPHRNPWSNPYETNLAGGTRHRYDHHSRDSLSRKRRLRSFQKGRNHFFKKGFMVHQGILWDLMGFIVI